MDFYKNVGAGLIVVLTLLLSQEAQGTPKCTVEGGTTGVLVYKGTQKLGRYFSCNMIQVLYRGQESGECEVDWPRVKSQLNGWNIHDCDRRIEAIIVRKEAAQRQKTPKSCEQQLEEARTLVEKLQASIVSAPISTSQLKQLKDVLHHIPASGETSEAK